MKNLNETKDELEQMRKTLLRTEEDRNMWRRVFEDCKKKHGEELERMRQEYNEQSERLGQAQDHYPQELLTPRELSLITEVANSSVCQVPG